jgi:hypothetical protein
VSEAFVNSTFMIDVGGAQVGASKVDGADQIII